MMTGPEGAGAPRGSAPAAPDAPLALIAGQGDLPRLIAEDRARRGAPLLVIRFEGTDARWAEGHDVLDLPFEKPGRLFRALRERGCREVCFAGAMTRPRLDPLRFDLTAMRLAPRVFSLLKSGDDAMLRGFAAIFEGQGFEVVGAHDQLSGLLAEAGTLGALAPGEGERADAGRAAEVVRALGGVDVGQAAVVARGVCLGLEAVAGTDALLGEVSRLPQRLRPAPGGVLYKAAKPGQDWRMDLPAIGPETVARAAEAGLSGICIAAGEVLVLGRAATVEAADAARIALWAAPAGAEGDAQAPAAADGPNALGAPNASGGAEDAAPTDRG